MMLGYPLLYEGAKLLGFLHEFFRLGLRHDLGRVIVEDVALAPTRLNVARQVCDTWPQRKLDGFEGRSSLRTWLYGICLRTAWDHRRRAHVRLEIAVAEPPQRVVEPNQESELSHADTKRLLASLLDRLDEDKRAVFVLYELEELPMKEVAEVVGCPLQTAYSRLHAARSIVIGAAEELQKGAGA